MLTLPLDWLASLSVSHFHVGCQMRKQLKRVISALFSCQSYYKIQHWHWLHNVRSSRDQGSMCVCVCVSDFLSVCVCSHIIIPTYLYSSEGSREPWGGNTNPKSVCVCVCEGKVEEGWRLRRMLLSSSVILQPLPPFSPLSTPKQPHRLKISHCYMHTKGHS